MSILKKTLLSFCLLTSAFPLLAQPKQEKMKGHLDMIRNILDVGYAPISWKEKHFGWNLDDEIEKAKQKVDEQPDISVKSFQKIVRDFFMSMHDLHVSARFHSTEYASLPFFVKGVDGKYYITYINHEMLSPSVYRMEKGDELVSFDGKLTDEVIINLQQELMSTTCEGTDRCMTELFLTNRIGSHAHDVPTEPIMIGIRKQNQQRINYYQLTWNYEPELVSNHFKINTSIVDKEKSFLEQNILKPQMVSSYNDFFQSLMIKDLQAGIKPGARKSFLPLLGKKWWSSGSDNTFYAYLYENECGHLIGYIRIPHYTGSTDEVFEFAKIIEYFEERSHALIIDQVNNPGGSLFYMYALAGILTDQPLYTPKHRVSISQMEVAQAIKLIPLFETIANDDDAKAVLGDLFSGHPVTHQMTKFFLNYFRFIVSEWQSGKTVTDATSLYGFDKINPSPLACYTKPILLLVNELSISCGDFFPAILQDNKRALVMGAKTSGAGGFVLRHHFPNLFGLSAFNYTGSIAERIDKKPIENLGVTPDILYKISSVDLQSSYVEYASEINKTINSMVNCETN